MINLLSSRYCFFQQVKLVITIVIFTQIASAQNQDSVHYSLVFEDCCTAKILSAPLYTNWYIIDSNENKILPIGNKVTLGKDEIYYLVNDLFGISPTQLQLNKLKNIDTFKSSCLKKKSYQEPFSWQPTMMKCEDDLNGIYTEYYFNGKIRVKGNYLDGKVKDTVSHYYSNGKLKSRTTVFKDLVSTKDYYPNASIKFDYNSNKKFRKSYFEDGRVMSKTSNKGLKSFHKYENGELRSKSNHRKQVYFYKNGEKEQSLKVKPVFFKDRLRVEKIDILRSHTWIKYDSTGQPKKEVNFYTNYHCSLYSVLLYNSAKQFNYLTYYYENLEVLIIPMYFYGLDETYILYYNVKEYDSGKFVRSYDVTEFKEVQRYLEKLITTS